MNCKYINGNSEFLTIPTFIPRIIKCGFRNHAHNSLRYMVPFLKQSFIRTINVNDWAAVHSLLQNAPDRSKRSTEALEQLFLENSGITSLAPLSFLNSETCN